MPRVGKNELTAKELKFVKHYNGNAAEAARLAGYKQNSNAANQVMQRQRVKDAIAKKQAALDQLRAKVQEEEVRNETRLIFVEKAEIIEGQLRAIKRFEAIVDQLKENGELGAHAKACASLVAAWDKLAELCQHKVHLSADISKHFEGKTIEEQEFFCSHGYFPDSMESAKPGTAGDQAAVARDTGKTKIQ